VSTTSAFFHSMLIFRETSVPTTNEKVAGDAPAGMLLRLSMQKPANVSR